MVGEVSRASDSGPARPTIDPEMAQCGCAGRWQTDGQRDRYGPRRQYLAAVGKYLSALRVRPVDRAMEKQASAWRYSGRAVCRRLRGGIPASERRRTAIERTARTFQQVRTEATPG